MTRHVAHRTSWDCGTCGEPWPCVVARASLTAEYAGHSVGLCLYLAVCLDEAMGTLRRQGGSPAGIYERFLGWVRTNPRPAPMQRQSEPG